MFGKELVGAEALGIAVIVPFIRKMKILDKRLGPIETLDTADVRQLDLGRVLGPVLAVGDKKLGPRRG